MTERLRASLRSFAQERPDLLRQVRRLRGLAVLGPHNDLVVGAMGDRNPPIATHTTPVLPGLDPHAAAAAVRRHGLHAGLALAPGLVDRVIAEAGRETAIGPHRSSAAVRAIAENDAVVAVARGYLGAEPHLFESFVVWSPPGHHPYKHTFHYDVADWRALSLFVYLTDVDRTSSPHQAVLGTHRGKSLGDLWRNEMSDEDVARRFGDRVETVVGPRGTAFFEDQTVIHRALGGATRMRGALIVTYTLRRGTSRASA